MIEIKEEQVFIALNAWTNGEDWEEATEQLLAELLGWA